MTTPDFFQREGWSEQVVTRLLVNPIYATAAFDPRLLDVEPDMDTEEWIELQAAVIEGVEASDEHEAIEGSGIESWLATLLLCLEGDLPPDHPVSPARAVWIDEDLCLPRPVMIDRQQWIRAQHNLSGEHGLYTYLDEMLKALSGGGVVSGPDGQPVIPDELEPNGLPVDAVDAFVLNKLRVALEAGALETALAGGGLRREAVLQAIADGTLDNETALKIGFEVKVAGLHDEDFDADSYDYEQGLTFVWPAERNEPCPCGSGLKFKRCCG